MVEFITKNATDSYTPVDVFLLAYCVAIIIKKAMPRPRRSNLSRRSRNATRIRNIANESTEEEQGPFIASKAKQSSPGQLVYL